MPFLLRRKEFSHWRLRMNAPTHGWLCRVLWSKQHVIKAIDCRHLVKAAATHVPPPPPIPVIKLLGYSVDPFALLDQFKASSAQRLIWFRASSFRPRPR